MDNIVTFENDNNRIKEDLLEFLSIDESADELFKRMDVLPIYTGITTLPSLPNGEIVEISGASCSGKTEFVLKMTMHSILPKEFGGNNSHAIFIDNDYHFDIYRLVNLLHNHIGEYIENNEEFNQLSNEETDEFYQEVIKDSLSRLHLFHCKDMFQFIVTLSTIKKMLKENLKNESTFLGYRLLIIDSISAFYWINRHKDDYGSRINKQLIIKLLNIVKEFNLNCLCTKSLLKNDMEYNDSYREYLGKTWRKVNHKIKLHIINKSEAQKYPIYQPYISSPSSSSPTDPNDYKYVIFEYKHLKNHSKKISLYGLIDSNSGIGTVFD